MTLDELRAFRVHADSEEKEYDDLDGGANAWSVLHKFIDLKMEYRELCSQYVDRILSLPPKESS
jgi:hypothetical protein